MGVFSTVLWGFWSDRSGKTCLLFAVSTGGAALAARSIGLSQSFWLILVVIFVFSIFNSTIMLQLDTDQRSDLLG